METLVPSNWYKGRIEPVWKDYQTLPYIHEPFNDQSAIDYWNSIGFTQTTFTGDMYDMRFDEPHWMQQVLDHFTEWNDIGWCVYRVSPGVTLPRHSDIFTRYKKVTGITDSTRIWRALILMEDWQSGHYLEVDNQPIVNYSAGDYIAWNNDVSHLAANMGTVNRYTLQLTGHINK